MLQCFADKGYEAARQWYHRAKHLFESPEKKYRGVIAIDETSQNIWEVWPHNAHMEGCGHSAWPSSLYTTSFEHAHGHTLAAGSPYIFVSSTHTRAKGLLPSSVHSRA